MLTDCLTATDIARAHKRFAAWKRCYCHSQEASLKQGSQNNRHNIMIYFGGRVAAPVINNALTLLVGQHEEDAGRPVYQMNVYYSIAAKRLDCDIRQYKTYSTLQS